MLAIAGLMQAFWLLASYIGQGWLMADAHAYWLTGQPGYHPYALAPGQLDAFLYSPAFAQIIKPLALLPWPAFAAVWATLEALAFVWLVRPLGLAWGTVAVLWCAPELVLGNIVGFIAVSIVLALTGWPQAWALPILTKPSLGVGVVWHVVLGEWRRLVAALATTFGVLLISFAVNPDMWVQWVRLLMTQAGSGGWAWYVRIVVALGLVVYSAKSARAWLVPFALLLATPFYGGTPVLMILAAVPRLVGARAVGPSTGISVERRD